MACFLRLRATQGRNFFQALDPWCEAGRLIGFLGVLPTGTPFIFDAGQAALPRTGLVGFEFGMEAARQQHGFSFGTLRGGRLSLGCQHRLPERAPRRAHLTCRIQMQPPSQHSRFGFAGQACRKALESGSRCSSL